MTIVLSGTYRFPVCGYGAGELPEHNGTVEWYIFDTHWQSLTSQKYARIESIFACFLIGAFSMVCIVRVGCACFNTDAFEDSVGVQGG